MPINLINICSYQYGATASIFLAILAVFSSTMLFIVKIEPIFKYFFLDKKTKEEINEKYRKATLVELRPLQDKLLKSLSKAQSQGCKISRVEILELIKLAEDFFMTTSDICDAILRGHARTSSIVQQNLVSHPNISSSLLLKPLAEQLVNLS